MNVDIAAGDFQPQVEKPKGYIGTYLTIWCGVCTHWEDLESSRKARAAREARTKGWRMTKEHGWLCPRCYQKPGRRGKS